MFKRYDSQSLDLVGLIVQTNLFLMAIAKFFQSIQLDVNVNV